MGLIIKDNTADFSSVLGAKKLELDTIITDKTLTCLDFSRKSTVPNLELKKGVIINDLTGDYSSEFKVTSVGNQTRNFIQEGGFLMRNTALVADEETGINLSNRITYYLSHNDIESALFIFWIKNPISNLNGVAVVSSRTNENIGNRGVIRVLCNSNGTISPSFGCVPVSNYSINDGKFHQIALVYNKNQPLKLYDNTIYKTQSATNALGFPSDASNLIIGQNSGSDGNNSTIVIGRIIIEDLTNGRNALDVIKEDYNYVNALGKYAGIEKRPFANL